MKTKINSLLRKNQFYFSMKNYLLLFFICSFNVVTFSQNVEEVLNNSTVICQKGNYQFNVLNANSVVADFKTNSCIPIDKGIPNELLLRWTVDRPGMLSFIIKALAVKQDIDFELYRLKSNQLHLVRCMATGPQIGESSIFNAHCLGMTGLQEENAKVLESKGCAPDKTNFAAPIFVNKREIYLLRIINFSSNAGFEFNLSGSAELTKEYLTFDISADKKGKEKEWLFELPNQNKEEFVNITWEFGEGAFPEQAKNVTSTTARFNSAGEKIVLLNLEQHGCQFQAQKRILVEEADIINLNEFSLLVHPNPFSETAACTVLSSGLKGMAGIKVYSTEGILIFHNNIEIKEKSTEFSIDGSAWPAGRYSVVIGLAGKEVNSTLIKI